ncbi:MAG: type II secretion system F family protein [Desulfobacterales bacterium]
MIVTLTALWIFLISLFLIEFGFYTYRSIRYPNRSRIRKRLQQLSTENTSVEQPDILRKKVLSEIGFLNTWLVLVPGIKSLNRLIDQANSSYSVSFYILISLFVAMTAAIGSSIVSNNLLVPLLGGSMLGAVPFLVLGMKKKRRIATFQKQLPEALELIARALKAGHAFTSGIKLAAGEFKDPLGSEFQATLDEINFGISVADAFKNMSNRIDCQELRFFVVSVILQRETGGNLAEIIEGLSQLIRDRFKFEGKIRVLSAEGRLSAAILVALPLIIALFIHMISPNYLQPLFTDPSGKIAAVAALAGMAFGIVFIKHMIKIRV